MRSSRLRCTAAIGVLLIAGVPATAGGAQRGVEVAGTSPLPQACAQNSPQAEDEARVAVVRDHAVAVWAQGGNAGLAWSSSSDGGRRWARSRALSGWTTCTGGPNDSVVNPRLSLAADGTRWLIATSMGAPAHIQVSRSAADSDSWTSPVIVGSGILDFPAVGALDARRAAVAWTDRAGDRVMTRMTADGGATWSAPAVVHTSDAGGASFAHLAARPDGPLVLVVAEPPLVPGAVPGRTVVYRSGNGTQWKSVGAYGEADVGLTFGHDGTFTLALTTHRIALLRSSDGRRWRTYANVSSPALGVAPAIGVDSRGRTLLATLVSRPGERHFTCVSSLNATGRLTSQRRLAPPSQSGAPGGNSFYVRPDAAGMRAGALVLDLRGTSSSPRSTMTVATRLSRVPAGTAC